MAGSRPRSRKKFHRGKKILQHASTSLIVIGMTYAIRDGIKQHEDNPFLNWTLFGPFMVAIDMIYKSLWVFSFKREPLAHLIDIAGGTAELFKKLGYRYLIKSSATLPVLTFAAFDHYNMIHFNKAFFRNITCYVAPSLCFSVLGEVFYDKKLLSASIAEGVLEAGRGEAGDLPVREEKAGSSTVAPGAGDTTGFTCLQYVAQCLNAACIAVSISDVLFYNVAKNLCELDIFENNPYVYNTVNTVIIFMLNGIISWAYTPGQDAKPNNSEAAQPLLEENNNDNNAAPGQGAQLNSQAAQPLLGEDERNNKNNNEDVKLSDDVPEVKLSCCQRFFGFFRGRTTVSTEEKQSYTRRTASNVV